MVNRLLAVAASVAIFTGCESGSSDGDDTPVVNYAGEYSNAGHALAPQQSGAKVTSMSLIQEGNALLATDNNGINFRGNISPEGSDGLSPFEIRGKTSTGVDVTIVGAFSRDGARARMNGNWIEPTHQSVFNAYSGDVPPPADAGTDAAPASADASTPAPTGDRSSIDYVNAPASFDLDTCTFIDDGGVGGWPITTLMRSVSVSGGKITMVYDDVSWPASGDPAVNGNCWFVLERGGWEAKTFDFLRPNQETKDVNEAAHLFGIRGGERVGVFVSTLARDKRRNGNERSNIYWITWP